MPVTRLALAATLCLAALPALADTPRVTSNFITTLGYGDPATIFDRSPRPDFDVFNKIA